MNLLKRGLLVSTTLTLAFSATRLVHADSPTPAKCGEAFEASQQLSKSGKLLAALDQLIICAQPSCPQFLTRECTSTFERITTALPTITLIARDSAGAPLVDVVVSMDGEKVADKISGLAVPVDPGLHKFSFEREDKTTVIVSALISEGDKNKPVVADFKAPEPKPAAVTAPKSAEPPPPLPAKAGIPSATYALGGLALAALTTGVVFRIVGSIEYNNLVDQCGRSCQDSQVDKVKAKYTISTIGFAVGAGALLAAGVVLAVGSGNRSGAEHPRASAWSVRPVVTDRGAVGFVEGHF